MLFQFYQDHFDWRARALIEGRYDDLARAYVFPLEVDLTGHRLAVEDAGDMTVHLHRYRTALRMRGVTRLIPRVIAMDLPNAGSRVWLRWRQAAGDDMLPEWADVEYRMQLDADGARIAAMRYSRLMMPEFGRAATHRRLVRSGD